jgi:hypothetical protein
MHRAPPAVRQQREARASCRWAAPIAWREPTASCRAKPAVFSVGHDLGLEAAIDLFDLGLNIRCVADIREDGQDPAIAGGLDRTPDTGAQRMGGGQRPRRARCQKRRAVHRGRNRAGAGSPVTSWWPRPASHRSPAPSRWPRPGWRTIRTRATFCRRICRDSMFAAGRMTGVEPPRWPSRPPAGTPGF